MRCSVHSASDAGDHRLAFAGSEWTRTEPVVARLDVRELADVDGSTSPDRAPPSRTVPDAERAVRDSLGNGRWRKP
jgi:hypothetical protein